ncbi:flavodoxin-dependent (E)-4-hydroxy-3-methylbut-2-enyl-diphosphate synthase [Candidatus Margulisiibacteriota bacterium]
MPRQTKEIKIGSVKIGNDNPIAIQSMTKTHTRDVTATVRQIKELEQAGCQIIRSAVKTEDDAKAISKIKSQISIPLVADIHFNHKLAIIAVNEGADKIRINPGNIGGGDKIEKVVSACKAANIPIRIGVNSGSLEKELIKKYTRPAAEALVEGALRNVKILEKLDFHDIVISIKATSVPTTIKAYELISKQTDYPLHVGITESGIPKTGIIRSAVGIGSILTKGIGDTIRVSLTGSPVEEVRVGIEILKSLELIEHGTTIISCPTCGRMEIDVEKIATEVEARTRNIKNPLKVAIMGCEVNGPGEAADADVGLAGGNGVGLIFRFGEVVRKVSEAEMVDALIDEIKSIVL